jgi:subtilisin family serine protease
MPPFTSPSSGLHAVRPCGDVERALVPTRTLGLLLLVVLFAGLLPLPAAHGSDGTAAANAVAERPVPWSSGADDGDDPRLARTDRIVVHTDSVASEARALRRIAELAGHGARLGRDLGGGERVIELGADLPLEAVERIAGRLEADGLAGHAEPDRRLATASVPNDPFYGAQWHLSSRYDGQSTFEGLPVHGIDVESAWSRTTGSEDVVVAVLDSGILEHPDIVDRLVPGYDFVDGDDDPTDPGSDNGCHSGWHGLHVAGTIGASTNNGEGVAGVDQRSRVQPVRVLGACSGYESSVADGIRWAAGLSVAGVPDNATPAHVINLSLGANVGEDLDLLCPPRLQNAVNAARDAGAVVIAAAGNQNTNAELFTPGNCSGVVTVAATSVIGDRAGYSNYGSVVDIAAPGGDGDAHGVEAMVLSLSNDGDGGPDSMWYAWMEGTSMAAPHVAGVASLLLAADPSLTPAELTATLQATATPFPASPDGFERTCSSDPLAIYHCGAGIVHAGAAVADVWELEPQAVPAPVLKATAGQERVALSWNEVKHDSGIEAYEVFRSTGSSCSTSSTRIYRGTALKHTATGLTGDTTYRFCAVAKARSGEVSPLSKVVSATPTSPPPTWASDATLRFDLVSGGLELTWPAAKGAVAAYDVYRDGTRIASTTSRRATVTNLKNEQRYRLQVRARSSGGSSAALDRWVTPSGGFSDVSTSSNFHTDIRWLATAEITRGCSGDRFCPTDRVTRQQMAAFLVRALGLSETSGVRFSDVPRGSLFEQDIDKLATAGITRGCSADRFCPTDRVTRQQMAAFLRRALAG